MKKFILNRALSTPFISCPRNINPKKLGVVLKDGSINFPNQETAIEYGINKCRDSLIQKEPFERAIGIKKSRVVFQVDGISGEVPVHNATEIVLHSHPDTYAKGCTTAFSSGDYQYFINKECIKKAYVVNSNGEYYLMSKFPGVDFSKINAESTFGDFNICMTRTLFGHNGVSYEQRDCLEKCIAAKDIHNFYDKFYRIYVKPHISRMGDLSKTLVDKTHEFWVKYGEKFGVKTETNFSNFTNP